MGRRASIVVGVLLGALMGPLRARAIPVTASSLEWLCESHRHIGIAEVELPAGLETPDSVRALSPVMAPVTRRLKGAPPDSALLDCAGGVRLRPGERREVLLFFDDSLRVDEAISLDDPESCTDGVALSMDFLLLRSRQAILDRLTRRLRRMGAEGRGAPRSEQESRDRARSLTFELPARSEAFSRLTQAGWSFLRTASIAIDGFGISAPGTRAGAPQRPRPWLSSPGPR